MASFVGVMIGTVTTSALQILHMNNVTDNSQVTITDTTGVVSNTIGCISAFFLLLRYFADRYHLEKLKHAPAPTGIIKILNVVSISTMSILIVDQSKLTYVIAICQSMTVYMHRMMLAEYKKYQKIDLTSVLSPPIEVV